MTLAAAILLGLYDVAKKQSLKRNSVLWVLLAATALSALIMSPFLSKGSVTEHLSLIFKAILVTISWISGMVGLKLLPLTTVSTLKASRPFFVVIFSIILFGESLNLWQWGGVALALLSLTLLSISSKKEGFRFKSNVGFFAMMISILAGVASALYDKHILYEMEPLFVQSWGNVYITVLLAICVLSKAIIDGPEREKFHWDWIIVLISVLICAADALYFFALKQDDALLSVISLVRRSSVIVSFVMGAILFKENKIREKAIEMLILLVAMGLLVYGSNTQ